jgi:hypothetical protein
MAQPTFRDNASLGFYDGLQNILEVIDISHNAVRCGLECPAALHGIPSLIRGAELEAAWILPVVDTG